MSSRSVTARNSIVDYTSVDALPEHLLMDIQRRAYVCYSVCPLAPAIVHLLGYTTIAAISRL